MLRFLSLVTLWAVFFGCGSAEAKVHSWAEDNDLWKEDNLNFAESNVSEETFNNIISAAEELYAPIAEEWKEKLVINRKWEDPTVNANVWRNGYGATEINMYGGLARRPEVLPSGFALVLCHELGHLYGGAPYIHVGLKMAAEGQSDFYGAGWCLKNVLEKIEDSSSFPSTFYMEKVCNEDNSCMRQLSGGQSLGNLLATMRRESKPDFETPDRSVVKRTNTSYPKTVQCRLDSYHNGTLGLDRPLCWFKP